MKLTKDEAVKVLVFVGFKNAAKADNDTLQNNLDGVDGLLDEDVVKTCKDKDLRKLLDKIVKAIDDEEPLELEGKKNGKPKSPPPDEDGDDEEEEGDEEESDEESDDDEDEDEAEEPKKKEGKKVKTATKKADKKGKKAEKPSKNGKPEAKKKGGNGGNHPAGSDGFGMRLGTRAARINAALSRNPLTLAEIAKKAKYEGIPFHGHMRKLAEGGFVEKVEGNKYRLTKNGEKAQKGGAK